MLNLHSLNPQQRLAVETLHGPVLILAGAGTGKTRVITFRIAHLIAKGVASANILAVTFTNKAAREMQERVNKLIPRRKTDFPEEKNNRPTICTFHSLCVRILRQHIERLGYKRNFVIYDESEQLGAVKKILAQISAKGEKTDPAAVLSLLRRFKNQVGQASSLSNSETGKMPVPLFADESVRALAQHIRARYESALRACNAVDFDDLILLTLKLFSEHPDVLEICRAKYRFVMADEYQDTNAAQFQLIHALTEKHRNFCVVGDDDQSIYGWRGAEIANLLDLEKHFPEVKIVKLEQNYRSTNTILNAANAIIKNNARRRPKQLWSSKGHGDKIILRAYNSDEDEARNLVEQIEFARLARRAPWSDNAILFRTNMQSRPLETALRQANVRYHLIGGQSFFDRREVKDFIAYLKMFINPHDDVSLLRIANVPARGLSDVTMERLLGASHERKGSVFAAMKNPLVQMTFQTPARKSMETFVEFIERIRAQIESGAGFQPAHPNFSAKGRLEACPTLQLWSEKFLDEIGYFNELRRSEKNPEAGENRIRNLRELMATLDNFGEPTAPLADRLQTFLEDITLDSEREEEKENSGDAVTLITMHSCKGLEFPRVYIVGLEEGLLPHTRSTAEGTLDEERRLFYVGVTRAMQFLTISHCAARKKYGQLMPCHPSRFLKELPPELVEEPDGKDSKPVEQEAGKNLFAAIRSAIG
ncbi:MAG TPA: UvrD-helicase domain-containing protein [Verrucomicrobiae bacterium]|nr:UvrD-helicase domain-containing protein [Verrucomicrobiae bacterium]